MPHDDSAHDGMPTASHQYANDAMAQAEQHAHHTQIP